MMVGDMPIICEINDDIENDYSNIKRTDNHEIEHKSSLIEHNDHQRKDDGNSENSFLSESFIPELKSPCNSDEYSPVEISSFINDCNFEFDLGYESSEIALFRQLDHFE